LEKQIEPLRRDFPNIITDCKSRLKFLKTKTGSINDQKKHDDFRTYYASLGAEWKKLVIIVDGPKLTQNTGTDWKKNVEIWKAEISAYETTVQKLEEIMKDPVKFTDVLKKISKGIITKKLVE